MPQCFLCPIFYGRFGVGLSIPMNLGIYTPLQQHSQCGENNVQLADIMIYMERDFPSSHGIGGQICYNRIVTFVLKKGKPARENPWAQG
jgi:hypothetical protein